MNDNIIDVNLGTIAGFFKLQKFNSKGECTGETEYIDNLITDYAFNYLLANESRALSNEFVYIAVGSGSATPAATDTALQAQLGTRTNTRGSAVSSNVGSPLYYSKTVNNWFFTQGQVVGNIAEVGLFTSATGNNAGTRALVRDSMGNPTTFTVLSNETLTVSYELRFYPNLSDTSGSVTISSISYGYTQRSAYITGDFGAFVALAATGGYSTGNACRAYVVQALPAVGAGPSGTVYGDSSYALSAYTTGNFYRDVVVTFGPSNGNVPGGIGLMLYGSQSPTPSSNSGFFLRFDTPIPKTNLFTLTMTFRIGYSRYTI